MIRSKLHRPWQPRMSDGQLLNPFAHTAEPDSSLESHEEIEQLEAQQPESAAAPSAAASDTRASSEPHER